MKHVVPDGHFPYVVGFSKLSDRGGIFRTHTKIAGSLVADVIKRGFFPREFVGYFYTAVVLIQN
jgi:hypothetical protein